MPGTTVPTVLIIEEDQQLRRLLGTILGGAGYRVLEARSHDRALELLASGADSVDVVIHDSPLSLERIGTGCKVLLLSCYAAASPGNGMLRKPFKPAALIEAVRKLLR
ncbi:MAG TPA: hypothetical protein VF767_03665 [Bryobacteraceae bacterium]